MRPTVALFDIDGTLVSCGGAGRASMDRAFADVFGAEARVTDFPFGGMTDRAIARAGLTHGGREASEPEIDALLARYLGHLETEVPRATRYEVLPGVVALLDALAPQAHVAIGLGTGNVEVGARMKLTRGALWDRFAFGGFGSDHEDRARLLHRGAERGAERLGVPLARARVVVIGDTPRDVAAARAIGAEVIAVATGGSPLATLAACAPDLAVANLADDRVRARIG